MIEAEQLLPATLAIEIRKSVSVVSGRKTSTVESNFCVSLKQEKIGIYQNLQKRRLKLCFKTGIESLAHGLPLQGAEKRTRFSISNVQ